MKFLQFLIVASLAQTACMAEHTVKLLLSPDQLLASSDIKCHDKRSGEMVLGSAPSSCTLSATEQAKYQKEYGEIIFNHSLSFGDEAPRFANEIYDLIGELALDYVERRQPDADDDFKEQWVELVHVVSYHESYWSHYRYFSDGTLGFVRGDRLNGFGLMQVDQRAHKDFVQSGEADDIEKNLIYGMDVLYWAYTYVRRRPCDNVGDDWRGTARSIYGVYNGGPKARCRWQNNDSPWRRNDRNFISHFDKKEFLKWIDQEV